MKDYVFVYPNWRLQSTAHIYKYNHFFKQKSTLHFNVVKDYCHYSGTDCARAKNIQRVTTI